MVKKAEAELCKRFNKPALCFCNGTAPIHTALEALDVTGKLVFTTPLTMAATTIAIQEAGGQPVFCDVDADNWTISYEAVKNRMEAFSSHKHKFGAIIAVSLYGHPIDPRLAQLGVPLIHDAAQSVPVLDNFSDFITLSFQASKIITCGEGGALLFGHAQKDKYDWCNSFHSLGYGNYPIDKTDPDADRHEMYRSFNYRMSDFQAAVLYGQLRHLDELIEHRDIIADGFGFILDQFTMPQQTFKYGRNYWAKPFLHERPKNFLTAYRAFGGEGGYAAWKLTYQEPAMEKIFCGYGICPTAEYLQPRIVALSNNMALPERSYQALRKTLERCK